MKNLRVRDQLFVDELQVHYTNFNENIEDSYLTWQRQTHQEMQAASKANTEAIGKATWRYCSLGLAVLAAAAGADSGSLGGQSLGMMGAVGGK